MTDWYVLWGRHTQERSLAVGLPHKWLLSLFFSILSSVPVVKAEPIANTTGHKRGERTLFELCCCRRRYLTASWLTPSLQWDQGVSVGLEGDVTPAIGAARVHPSPFSPSLSLVPLALSKDTRGCRDTSFRLVGSGKVCAAESVAGKLRTAEHTPSSCHPLTPSPLRYTLHLPEGSTTLHQHKDTPKRDPTSLC